MVDLAAEEGTGRQNIWARSPNACAKPASQQMVFKFEDADGEPSEISAPAGLKHYVPAADLTGGR